MPLQFLSFTQGSINNSIVNGKGAMPHKTGFADSTADFAMNRLAIPIDSTANKFRKYANKDASSVIERRKNAGVVKTVNVSGGPLAFDTKHDNSARDALRRVRCQGAVVPQKVQQQTQRGTIGLPSHPLGKTETMRTQFRNCAVPFTSKLQKYQEIL
jgi:hypothetical protein